MTGIYKITINDHYIYIGQSVDIENRWNGHINELKRNRHCNTKLQNVYNKHSDSIKFEIVEECDERELDSREIFYIEQFNTFGTKHGLNMSIGGDCGCRKYRTKEEAEVAKKQWYIDHEEESRQYDTQYRRQKGMLSWKERFEKHYNLSRPLTNKEWDIWITDKSISGSHSKFYATRFLQSLPNLTFTIPPKK